MSGAVYFNDTGGKDDYLRNTKSPSAADDRERIERMIIENRNETGTIDSFEQRQLADDIVVLLHQSNVEVLDRLLAQKKTYITELHWKHAASEEAVPVAIIERQKQELKEEV